MQRSYGFLSGFQGVLECIFNVPPIEPAWPYKYLQLGGPTKIHW